MNLSGKTCLITGANSGLGFATAKQFAKLGANLVLLYRDREKGENTVSEVKKQSTGGSIELMICDLTSIRSVQKFIEEFKESHDTLDILFNNAVIIKRKRSLTADNLEVMFQTNYLSIFQLTNSLIDLLKKSPDARIINIAIPPNKYRLDFEDLQAEKHYSMMDAFWRSKLCVLLFSLKLAQDLEKFNTTVNCIDPGPFESNITREAPKFVKWIKSIIDVSADEAAKTIVYYATLDEVKNINGRVFVKKKEKSIIPYWKDKSVREQLWNISQSIIDNILK
jgi:NAD(P)-dependent dehydrogenase (short-subunit alcohol dehydrogenase family)